MSFQTCPISPCPWLPEDVNVDASLQFYEHIKNVHSDPGQNQNIKQMKDPDPDTGQVLR